MSLKSFIKSPITYRTIKDMKPQEKWYIACDALIYVYESSQTIFILLVNEPFSENETHISEVDIFNSNTPLYNIPISCINPWKEYVFDNSESELFFKILSCATKDPICEILELLNAWWAWFKTNIYQNLFSFFDNICDNETEEQKTQKKAIYTLSRIFTQYFIKQTDIKQSFSVASLEHVLIYLTTISEIELSTFITDVTSIDDLWSKLEDICKIPHRYTISDITDKDTKDIIISALENYKNYISWENEDNNPRDLMLPTSTKLSIEEIAATYTDTLESIQSFEAYIWVWNWYTNESLKELMFMFVKKQKYQLARIVRDILNKM